MRPIALLIVVLFYTTLTTILINAATRTPITSATRTAQSWDQENLKRNDSGCPTAIYVAPAGNLELCE